MRLIVCILVLSGFGFSPQTARADLTIEILTGAIDAERIDALIAENARNPQIAFDLLKLKAEMSSPIAAAEIHLMQAALAERHPDTIDADLPSLYLDAVARYREAGETERALEALYIAIDRMRDRAATPKRLAKLLERAASLEVELGNNRVAANLRAEAASLPTPQDAPPPNRSNDPGFVSIEVFFATDREQTGREDPARVFGYGRADELSYGLANVTIPKTHVPGALAAPSIWKLEFSQNPTKHVILQSVEPVVKEAFFNQMRSGLSDRQASEAFVFVHGYNVSFDNAAKRTAQLAYDMNFKGLPILYSWPSKGATVGYIQDTAVVRLSGRRLRGFLADVAEQSGASTIHLIAHSMGNRAMTDALELLALENAPLETPMFDQVIFAAPDVDRGLFAAMLPTLRPIARRVTLYASDNDWALEASRKLHGNAPRAGQAGVSALSQTGLDTVDMSQLGDDMLAHSYVNNDESAILDIATLFWRNPDPSERCGLEARAGVTGVWDYKRSDCSTIDLVTLVGSLRNAGASTKAQIRDVLRNDFKDQPQGRKFEKLLLDLAVD